MPKHNTQNKIEDICGNFKKVDHNEQVIGYWSKLLPKLGPT